MKELMLSVSEVFLSIYSNILNIPPGKKHNTCKGPGAGEGLADWRKEKATVPGEEPGRGRGQGERITKGLVGHYKDFGFCSERGGSPRGC